MGPDSETNGKWSPCDLSLLNVHFIYYLYLFMTFTYCLMYSLEEMYSLLNLGTFT